MEVTGPVTFDVTKIQATDQYFSNNLGGGNFYTLITNILKTGSDETQND